ncbi:hypothetical protein HanIR_Chr15g0756821 [Helianthus annuus]|nr:hypothetical protein HanIR_Chr15g0756821 [Helianthus annuus]
MIKPHIYIFVLKYHSTFKNPKFISVGSLKSYPLDRLLYMLLSEVQRQQNSSPADRLIHVCWIA